MSIPVYCENCDRHVLLTAEFVQHAPCQTILYRSDSEWERDDDGHLVRNGSAATDTVVTRRFGEYLASVITGYGPNLWEHVLGVYPTEGAAVDAIRVAHERNERSDVGPKST